MAFSMRLCIKHANICLQGSVLQMSTDTKLAELEMLQLGVQQLLSAYNTTLMLCTNHTA